MYEIIPYPPPITKRLPHSGIILLVLELLYISSSLLALGISSTLNQNAEFYPLPLPQSIRFQCLLAAYKIEKQTTHSQKALSNMTPRSPSSLRSLCNLSSSLLNSSTFLEYIVSFHNFQFCTYCSLS